MLHRVLSLASALAIAVALPAVSVSLAAETAAPAAGDPVVARVNGKELHRSDVEAAQKSMGPQVQHMPLETIYPMLLDQMVNGMLVTDAARKEKLEQDPEVKKRLARLEDRLVQEAYINKAVEKETSEDKLKERYQQYLKDNPPKEQVSARHILVEKEDQAKAIIKELDKGADFAKLAKEKSTDPAAAQGGDLGFFSREEMVPEFSDAAFKLKKGEYTKQPVKSQFGWHVIKVEDRRTSAPPTFEEAREEMQTALAREIIGETVGKLRHDAKVETFALDGSPMPAPAAAPAAPAPATK
jgi:peptidyl-prolyl cis-trans isomerase C